MKTILALVALVTFGLLPFQANALVKYGKGKVPTPISVNKYVVPGDGYYNAKNNSPTPDNLTASQTEGAFTGDVVTLADNRPCTGWLSKEKIYFACWTGSKWAGLANPNAPDVISNNGYAASEPHLALDNEKRPHIAWVASVGTPAVRAGFYSFWDGTTWRGQGGGSGNELVTAGFGDIGGIDLAIDYGFDRPGVIFDNSGTIWFRSWNGANWEGYLGTADSASLGVTVSFGPQMDLEFANNGHPHVVFDNWDPWGTTYNVYLSYFAIAKWRGHQGNGPDVINSGLQALARNADLAIDGSSGRPGIVWSQRFYNSVNNAVLFRYWNGSAYVGLTGAQDELYINAYNNIGTTSLSYSLAGTPGAAWFESEPFGKKYVRFARYNGTVWTGLKQAGSDRVYQVGNNYTGNDQVSLSLDTLARPQIVWTDRSAGYYNSDVRYSHWYSWRNP